jgi:hypothetical protein
MKTSAMWAVFILEIILFAFFDRINYKIFAQYLPLLMIIEIGYFPNIAANFKKIRQLNPDKIIHARISYLPAVVGLLGFAAIGLGFINGIYVSIVGIASSFLILLGKIMVYRYIRKIGILI